jgi:hypothetical protein
MPSRRSPAHLLALAASIAGAAGVHASAAQATEPTTAECMIAHDEGTDLRAKHDLRAARARLQVCSAETCPAGLRAACADEARQVSAAIPTLILDAVDAAGNDVSHVTVTMDGEPLIDRIDGTAVAVEPGAHRFSFRVAGRPEEVKTLFMTEGEKNKRVRIAIAPPPPPASHEGETQRLLGLAFGGTALLAAGVGTGFGLSARSNLAKSRADCADPASDATCANLPLAASEQQAANTQATIATGAFIGAGAFLMAGALLFFSAPRALPATTALDVVPGVGQAGGSILLRGTF